jgi:hypothetical protein
MAELLCWNSREDPRLGKAKLTVLKLNGEAARLHWRYPQNGEAAAERMVKCGVFVSPAEGEGAPIFPDDQRFCDD